MFEFVDLIKLNNDKNNYKYKVVLLNTKTNKLNNIKMEDNFYLNLDNEREEILILNLQQENNKLDLISKLNISDI